MTTDRLGFATALARKAGELAQRLKQDRAALALTAKGPQDFATNADYQVEALIRKRIAETYPDDAVLAEEHGMQGHGTGCWIIDPIDGTVNYARGLSDWGISIAYFDGTDLTVGVIFAPDLDLMATAQSGGHAQINGKVMTLNGTDPVRGAVVSLGYSDRAPLAHYLTRVDRLMGAGIEHRRHGAATIGLIGVIAGWFDAYYEPALNVWDAAAGLVMIKAAGGTISHGAFPDFLSRPTDVLATNGGLPDLAALVTITEA